MVVDGAVVWEEEGDFYTAEPEEVAVGRNPIGLVIPCHRVVRGDGGMGGYRWGVARKEALLERERR